jgi:hypothetical protein
MFTKVKVRRSGWWLRERLRRWDRHLIEPQGTYDLLDNLADAQ